MKNTKVLVLNLPYHKRITRRYMCSYVSPTSLFPPIELLSVATYLEKNKINVKVVDCIEQSLSPNQVVPLLEKFQPDFLITLIGFETFDIDIKNLGFFKSISSNTKQIGFGYYPTLFDQEIKQKSTLDFVVKGEPEGEIFKIIQESTISETETITSFNFKKTIPNLNLLDSYNYFETLMPSPLGVIQTARGCPYTCNFCVKSFGSRLNYKPVDTVLNEIKNWIKIGKAKSIRFIDDTFTISENRVLEICEKISALNLKLSWSCLSRIDTLNQKMIEAMTKSGCKRIYFGIESGSQRMLDLYSKNYDIKKAHQIIDLCKKYNIETVGFFMTGLPDETDEDFDQTLHFIKDSSLSLVGLGQITLYPGTDLFEQYKNQLDFKLFPYSNKFKDTSVYSTFEKRRKKFNSTFYMSNKMLNVVKIGLLSPKELFKTTGNILTSNSSGIKSLIPSLDLK